MPYSEWLKKLHVDWPHAAGGIPAGVIAMWSGTLATIPAGWTLCDGTAGTPDLRDRFVYGSSAGVDPGGTGGAPTHTHAGHAAHVVTQPSAHAAHVVTQPSAHSDHADNIAHVHTQRYFPTATGASIGNTLDTSMSGTQTNTSVQTASQGTGASLAHSAHAGAGVDAHSPHSGGSVDAHSAHDAPSSEPPFFRIAYIMKT